MTEFFDLSPENLELRYRLLQRQTIADEAYALFLQSQGKNPRETREKAHAISDEEFYRLCGRSATAYAQAPEPIEETSAA